MGYRIDIFADANGNPLDGDCDERDPLPCDGCDECPDGFVWSAFGGELCAECQDAARGERRVDLTGCCCYYCRSRAVQATTALDHPNGERYLCDDHARQYVGLVEANPVEPGPCGCSDDGGPCDNHNPYLETQP